MRLSAVLPLCCICRQLFKLFRQIFVTCYHIIVIILMAFCGGCSSSRSSSPDYESYEQKQNEPITYQPRSSKCSSCAQLRAENKKVTKNEEDAKEAYITIIEKLQHALRESQKKYDELEHRSDEITAKMSSVLDERSSDLENVNDEFSNTKLAKRFRGLYDNTWADLSEWIDDNVPGLGELERIQTLTKLMQTGYERCLRMANDELRVFLYLQDGDRLPTNEEDPVLYKIRRKYGQTKNKREGVTKIIFEELLKKSEVSLLLPEDATSRTEGLNMIKTFFLNYLECCWLMTISNPRLVLDFNVRGYKYDGYIKDRFTVFSCQDQTVSATLSKGDIYEVVWPSVELEDASGIHSKGDVITVDIVDKDLQSNSNTLGNQEGNESTPLVDEKGNDCKENKLTGHVEIEATVESLNCGDRPMDTIVSENDNCKGGKSSEKSESTHF